MFRLGSVKYCGRRLAMRSNAFDSSHAPAISEAPMICQIECTNGLSGRVAGGADRVEVAHPAAVRAIARPRNSEVFVRNRDMPSPIGGLATRFDGVGCCGMFGARAELGLIQR